MDGDYTNRKQGFVPGALRKPCFIKFGLQGCCGSIYFAGLLGILFWGAGVRQAKRELNLHSLNLSPK